ncbi:tripartite tricarboxylate transporter TctB family protein [Mailhella massiliensis]|uniref:tripartite tricarboxylate transporter TctB family protein n=1 Tax=Mailhella massiliensis TaxID=1903261 RepID=UPI0023F5559E|nr:tripartite tricarboxylate transporter TctB family protein [Mailhella massiliensis]
MIPFSVLLRRRALRILLFSAGVIALLASPPAFSEGLPGPGLWSRVTGAGLLACAMLTPAAAERKEEQRHSLRPLLGLVFSALLWTALLIPAGWAAATFLAGSFACRKAGCGWRESLLIPALLCLLLYAGMVRLLQWPLPEGLFFPLFAGA